MKTLVWVLGTLLAGPATAQVFKCTVDGATVYQARPCATAGGTGEEVRLHVTPPAAPSPAARAAPAPPPSPPQAQAPPAPPPPLPQKSWLELEADACLAWYRPKLRDPRSAYYRNPTKDGQVLTMTLHATNGSGGYATEAAACEIKGGDVDEGWTKLHAERLGWMTPCARPVGPLVPLVPGTPPPANGHKRWHDTQDRGIRACDP